MQGTKIQLKYALARGYYFLIMSAFLASICYR